MAVRRGARAAVIAALLVLTVLGAAGLAAAQRAAVPDGASVHFATASGPYSISYQARSGAITIRLKGKSAGLTIHELGGVKAANLLSAVSGLL